METPEIIDGLKDLIKDRNSFIDQNEPDNVFEHDKEVLKAAINALSATPENKPLTLDELREICKERIPVWIAEKGNPNYGGYWQYAYDFSSDIMAFFTFGNEVEELYDTKNYGKTWVAYASKPEEK